MNVSEIRTKTNHELDFELAKFKKELFDTRFKSATQSLPSPARIGELRRVIARVQTILQERSIGVRGQKAN